MSDSINNKEFNNNILKSEITAFKKEQSKENSVSLLHCLHKSSVFVPGKIEDVKEADENGKRQAHFTPSMLKLPDGKLIFPVLSSRNEAPVLNGKKINGIVLPFISICKMVDLRPDCNLIIINPFTDKFPINEQMYKTVLKIGAQAENGTEHKIGAGEQITFFGPESADIEYVEKIKSVFTEYDCIKTVYFSRMLADSQITFVLIIEFEGEEDKTIYGGMIKKISDIEKPRLPISVGTTKAFAKMLDNDKIKMVYRKNIRL